MSEAVKGVLFLRQMQDSVEPSMRIGAANVFEDDKGAIKLVAASRRTKHIDLTHHLMRDACDAGKAGVVFVRIEDEPADLVTKPLDMHRFYKYVKTFLDIV